jgi:hypothetical protein
MEIKIQEQIETTRRGLAQILHMTQNDSNVGTSNPTFHDLDENWYSDSSKPKKKSFFKPPDDAP